MDRYEKALALWQSKHIHTDAELAEALNGHPPVTIHQEDRKDYYAALEAWDERQELQPMEAFLREQTVKTWAKQIERGEAGFHKTELIL